MCVNPGSARNSYVLPARNNASVIFRLCMKYTLSSAVPWMINSGTFRSLHHVSTLLFLYPSGFSCGVPRYRSVYAVS